MGKKSKINRLPPEAKAKLDRTLIERGFADYQPIAEEMRADGHDVSKSGLHRYGQDF